MTINTSPKVEQHLAHALLVELLAYQFASPVRWIETQDVIFGLKNAKRVVEIGPGDTLRVMAQRTLAAKYDAYDAAHSIQRQVLTLAKDEKEICYEVDSVEENPRETSTSIPLVEQSPASVAPPPLAAAVTNQKAPPIADAAMTATDVVRAVIAHKLKKPLPAVSLSESIKILVKGKSTLQNELLGDLGNEFGSLPDNTEETPLDELGGLLQTTYNGGLGKQTSSLVAKMFSTKMPGGFNGGAARKHMEVRWGLGPQRQQGVMVLALTMQPASRLGRDDEAKAFFDQVAGEYATQAGIDLAVAAAGGDAATPGAGVILDSAALEAVTKDQRNLFTRQHELLAAHLKLDFRAADEALLSAQSTQSATEAKLDLWNNEHGELYGSGISPTFNSLKVRVYDSSWNWVREDVMSLYYDLVFERIKICDQELGARKARIVNRANPKLLDLLQHLIDSFNSEQNHGYRVAREVLEQLTKSCKRALDSAPVFKGTLTPTAPRTIVDAKGVIEYEDMPRKDVSTLEAYVQDMTRRVRLFETGISRSQNHKERIFGLVQQQHKASDDRNLKLNILHDDQTRPMSPENFGQITPPKDDVDDDTGVPGGIMGPVKPKILPFLHLKQRKGSSWKYCGEHSRVYLSSLEVAARSGISFQGKTALVTGTGAGSIGAMVLEGLISGGAKVIATTSSFSREVTEYYHSMYAQHGARGSQLVIVPFNQGSKQDVENLVEYIFNADKGLGWDLDYIVPFAAISENGKEIDSINSKSELAHRIMLTNLLRLLGFIKKHKLSRGYDTRPSQVILPLSPNHGTFGGDGLYSESKIALETLFNKWHSEVWSDFLTICGANIGWTRGTGLMSGNNIIAEEVERLEVRTFSQQEMAFNILGLMTPAIVQLCEVEPVYADLTGSINSIPDLKTVTGQVRKEMLDLSATREALTRETAREARVVNGENSASIDDKFEIEPRANLTFQFPQLPDFKTDIAPLGENLKEMVDLERVVVVTGFSELGPWGNSRTRWEMEASGKLSLEGCIELAWIMGLIKHHNGLIKGRQGQYSGWVDSKTGDPIHDGDVKSKYEKHILEHTGIRLVEHELIDGRDNRIFQEVVIREDLMPFEASKETAEDLKKQHGDKLEIFPSAGSDEYSVRLKTGATIAVPKSVDNDHFVAGQVPSGWDARQYGIPEDIISQVDKATLYVLVCTAEALLAGGITDPYELYQYVHVSEVGNCIGSGFGAAASLRAIFKDRTLDKPVQNDILQETFINTLSAWVNMLLISSSGPLRTPVGACATAVESIDLGYDTIVTGKAQVCLVGACDSFQEETATEFMNMKATSNAKDELARGRTPKEMSRPTTTTRNGFVESEGCGIQVIMSAKLALEMGLPIWGIVALTATASDKIGRSVPAPGQGILTVAREEQSNYPSPLLNIKYRRAQLEIQLEGIKAWQKSAMMHLSEEVVAIKTIDGVFDASDYMQDRACHIDRKAKRQRSEALNSWGNDFWKQDPTIAPLRGALATWGLTIDDLSVASLHGTSTVANDKNEADVVSKQLRHLGRKKGNVILSICQKHLTGHPKGPAGAWMLNGALQVLNSGLVPGNRNADNVDKKLEEFDLMFYPSRSIQTNGVKAFSATSFGFGQKSAQVIGIHPRYLFATLDEASYDVYKMKAQARQKRAYRHIHTALAANTLFQAKENPPYAPAQETQLLLSPTARATIDKGSSSFSYSTKLLAPQKLLDKLKTEDEYRSLVDQLNSSSASNKTRIGVDIEDIAAINISSETFVVRNFSEREQAYCQAAPFPQASFAGRWCAKEAVFKSLGVAGRGAGASMKEIEITSDANGAPCVTLHGDADARARKASVKSVGVSISHSETQAVAVAMASL